MSEKKAVKKTLTIKQSGTRGKQEAGKWFIVDAKGKVLGRLATRIARILTGKDKKTYVPYWESGDHVVVINAKEIQVTGKKSEQKIYDHYTGYPGGIRQYNFEKLIEKDPREVILRAVKGMIPKNRLGDLMMTHLLIYPGSEHRHKAQNPTPINL
ncbi:MAG: 50S ribosomal protein L13 [Candidatus Omnitrophica bacterium]|nr:50S ribosomal protein L13 [Candidatus Omnitrophota bacterium]